jgi:hypothetical protein
MTIEWNVRDDEVFEVLGRTYDVKKAKTILKSKRRISVCHVDVKELEPLLARQITLASGKKMLRFGVHVDWDRARTDASIDTNVPLVIAYFASGPELTMLPIDGYHRIARAVLRNVSSLPSVLLSKKESNAVLIR